MPSSGVRLLTIGEFSRLSRISVRMLRHYDEHGVLHPTRTDPFSGYRYYSAELLRTASRVCELRDVGLRVAEIAACTALLDDPAGLRAVLAEQRDRLNVDADAVAARLRKVDHLITRLEAPTVSIAITQRHVPEHLVASVRGTIPTYADEGRLWERLMGGLPASGAAVAADAKAVAVFHDDDAVEADADVEVRLDVAAPFTDAGDVRCVRVPEQEVVLGVLRGSYEGITDVTEALGAWIAEHGYRFAGPMFNVYLVSPSENPDPSQWVTEVCIPVEAA